MSNTIQGAMQLTRVYAKGLALRKDERIRKHTRQIISKGRTNPVPVQSGINQTVIVSSTPQAARLEATVIRPGPKEALVPKMGDIALIEPDDIGARIVKRTQGASITDVYAFSALNGFPANRDFLPLGVFANAQDISNPNRDGAGAVQTAGTVLIVNHGDEKISPGQLVYVDVPDVVKPDGSDKELPLIKEMGAHPDRFVVATRPLHWNSERDYANAIEVELEKLVKDNWPNNANQLMTKMDDRLRNYMMIRYDSPMYNYGICYGCNLILNKYLYDQCFGDDSFSTLLKELAIKSYDHITKLAELADKHNGYTYEGVTGKYKRMPSRRVTSFLDEFNLTTNFSNIDDGSLSDTEKLRLACKLQHRITVLTADWYTEIIGFYRRRVLGKALDYALPGSTFVIQLGYFHS